MTRVIAVANPQARSGKTAAAFGLATALVAQGATVLAVDLDPQAALTRALGTDPDRLDASLADVLVAGVDAGAVMVDSDEGVDLVPAALDLSGIEGALLTRAGREGLLAAALAPVARDYDWLVVDAASSLGLLTTMALAMADELIVPERLRSERALTRLLDAASEIRRFVNPRLGEARLLPITMVGHPHPGMTLLPAVPTPPDDHAAYATLAAQLIGRAPA